MKSTRFAFTCLRPDDAKVAMLSNIPDLQLYFYGNETGKVSAINHLQGYLEVSKPIELFKLKSYIKPFYVEIARESRYSNYIYCSKGGKLNIYNPQELDILGQSCYNTVQV